MPPEKKTHHSQTPIRDFFIRITKLAGLYLIAALGGWCLKQIGAPLPWMIGPLVVSAAFYISGKAQAPVPVQTRPFGQMIIASTVGTYFTPHVLQTVLSLTPLLIGMALVTALTAFAISFLLSRLTEMSLTQAILSTFPTSPVEAAVIAEKFGLSPGPVVLSQTVRIAAIVILIPISIYTLDGWPDGPRVRSVNDFNLHGVALISSAALIGAAIFRFLKFSNPYFLGALAFSSAMSALNFELTHYPPIVLSIAQVVLGTWLGSTFRRELFMAAGQLVTTSVMTTLLMLILNSTIATTIAFLFDIEWETLVLGAAPGGVTEMALTAKYLGLDVAVITAFQLTRIFIFMPNIPLLIRIVNKWETHRKKHKP